MFSLPPKAATRAGHLAGGASFALFGGVFTTRSFQIQGFNQHTENDVVHDRIADTQQSGTATGLLLLPDSTMSIRAVRERGTVTYTQQDTDGNASSPEWHG